MGIRHAAVACVLAACVQSHLVPCGDKQCPINTTCVANELCASDDQIAACAGHPNGDTCSVGTTVGRCDRGVCIAGGCGNHVVDLGEACDDGNQAGGDGCSADCLKLEACGDGVVDEGEACDDANPNAADGCDQCVSTMWSATAVIGGNLDALSKGLSWPAGIAVDRVGNLFVTEGNRVLRVDVTGVVTTVAGTGTAGLSGDGGVATSAQLNAPAGVAVDGVGNVFVADWLNSRIRMIDVYGVITTVAGTTYGFSGDNGVATSAQLAYPGGVAVDGLGNVFIADTYNNRVRRVDTSGVIRTVAGDGVGDYGGDGWYATYAHIRGPADVALDSLGDLYIADAGNSRIRKVSGYFITTVAGNGGTNFSDDGVAATEAALDEPQGVSVDEQGRIFIADTFDQRIRQVDQQGTITTLAGSGGYGVFSGGFAGDGGPASAALLSRPQRVAASLGHVYIADTFNNRIRDVDANAVITTIAGSGTHGTTGDGGAATSAPLMPSHVASDGPGSLYVSEFQTGRIRRIVTSGVITTVAGTGINGYGGDGGLATDALISPGGMAVDAAGNLYFADTGNSRVRRIDATTGVITTVAGTGVAGYDTDGVAATAARLNYPSDVAFDADGNLFIADSSNNRIRRVDKTTGVITTYAGTGTWGYNTEPLLATNADLKSPSGLAIDSSGNLFIADSLNFRIRRVEKTTGLITTVAGNGSYMYSGDDGEASAAAIGIPSDVTLDGLGAMYIADTKWNAIRRVQPVDPTGTITKLVWYPDTRGAFGGDGGLAALGARLYTPRSVAADGLGDVYIADENNRYVRRIDAQGIITTVAGAIDPEAMGPLTQARLAGPRALALAPPFTLFAGGSTGTVQALWSSSSSLAVVAGRYPQNGATDWLARFRDRLFGTVSGIAYDPAGAIYFTETSRHKPHMVTMVDPSDPNTWTIAPLANQYGGADFGDGPINVAYFHDPTGLYFDAAAHQLYVADSGNHVIRAIDMSAGITGATVTTVIGVAKTRGFYGDGGPANQALLNSPQAITRCPNGDLFIADAGNNRVRRVTPDWTISTVLGDGVAASSGEGSPASTFPVNRPLGLACDGFGNLYVTSTTTVRLVPADANGVVDGSGEVQTIYGAAPRDTFPASVTRCLTGLAVVDAKTVQVTDECSGLLVELRRGPRT